VSLAGRGEWPKTGYSVLRAADVTTERREELWDSGRQIAAGEGVGLEDLAVANDRPAPPAPPLLPLLGGVLAHGARTDLFLGGANLWRVIRQPQAVAASLLLNGFSPLLPPGHSAVADQLAPVPGGVVAHISDTSTGITYGAPGRVIFIPAGGTAARVIARATMIAVSPDGRRYGYKPRSSPWATGRACHRHSRARPGRSTWPASGSARCCSYRSDWSPPQDPGR
jgi:hypothetical protein